MSEQRDKSVAELVFDVSERTSTLIREEIELAKAEVSEKVSKLARGGAVGIVAGTFAFLALILIMHGFAWLLNDLFFNNDVWAGFFVEAALFLLVAVGAGYFAYRSFQAGAPLPEQAIEEAKLIRGTFEGEDTAPPTAATPGAAAPTPSATPASTPTPTPPRAATTPPPAAPTPPTPPTTPPTPPTTPPGAPK